MHTPLILLFNLYLWRHGRSEHVRHASMGSRDKVSEARTCRRSYCNIMLYILHQYMVIEFLRLIYRPPRTNIAYGQRVGRVNMAKERLVLTAKNISLIRYIHFITVSVWQSRVFWAHPRGPDLGYSLNALFTGPAVRRTLLVLRNPTCEAVIPTSTPSAAPTTKGESYGLPLRG